MRMRPGPAGRRRPSGLSVYLRFNPLLNGHGGGGIRQRGRRVGDDRDHRRAARSRCPTPPTPSPRPSTAATPRPSTRRWPRAARSGGGDGLRRDRQRRPDRAGLLRHADQHRAGRQQRQCRADRPARPGPGADRSADRGAGLRQHLPAAVGTALAASATPFAATYAAYQAGWQAYDARLLPPGGAGQPRRPRPGVSAYWLSANVLKASEDKTFPGATAASLSSPWGQAVPAGQPANGLAPYFGSYREVFPRDAYETFTGFLTDGDLATARQIVPSCSMTCSCPDGSFPRNGAAERAGRAGHRRPAAGRDRRPDPDGLAGRAGR